jgi:hypothetical protein
MKKDFITDVGEAIQRAHAVAPCGLMYKPGSGWAIYSLSRGVLKDCQPEFLIVKRGVLPIPLNDHAEQVLLSLILGRT